MTGEPTYRTTLLTPGLAVLVCSDCAAMLEAGSAEAKRVHTSFHRQVVWQDDQPGAKPIGSGPIGTTTPEFDPGTPSPSGTGMFLLGGRHHP
jgi:hypothetical protein